jgi:hypothetical protein
MPALLSEREGSTNILVSGGEGRTAARRNVLVTTEYRNARRRLTAAYLKSANPLQGYQTGLSLYADADKTFYHTCRGDNGAHADKPSRHIHW